MKKKTQSERVAQLYANVSAGASSSKVFDNLEDLLTRAEKISRGVVMTAALRESQVGSEANKQLNAAIRKALAELEELKRSLQG